MTNEYRPCPAAWETLNIYANGAMTPCAYFKDNLSDNTTPLITESYSIFESFHSEAFNKVRKNILKNNPPLNCIECSSCEKLKLSSPKRENVKSLDKNSSVLKLRNTSETGQIPNDPEQVIVHFDFESKMKSRLADNSYSRKQVNEFSSIIDLNSHFLNFLNVSSYVPENEENRSINEFLLYSQLCEIKNSVKKITFHSESSEGVDKVAYLLERLSKLEESTNIDIYLVSENCFFPPMNQPIIDSFHSVKYKTNFLGPEEIYSYIYERDDYREYQERLKSVFNKLIQLDNISANIELSIHKYNILNLKDIVNELFDMSLDKVPLTVTGLRYPSHLSIFNLSATNKMKIIDSLKIDDKISSLYKDLISELTQIDSQTTNHSDQLFYEYNDIIDKFRNTLMPKALSAFFNGSSNAQISVIYSSIDQKIDKSIRMIESLNFDDGLKLLNSIPISDFSEEDAYKMGSLLYQFSQNTQVAHYFDQYLRLENDNFTKKKKISWIYKKIGELDKSFHLHIELYNQYTDTEIFESLCSGGWDKLSDHLKRELITFYKKFINTKSYHLVVNSLSHCLKSLGEIDESLKFHLDAIALNPNASDIYDSLTTGGWLNLSPAGLLLLVSFYNQELKKTPSNIAILKNLVWILKQQGNISKAFTLLEEVIKVEPSDQQVIDNLNKGGWLELEGKQLEHLIVFYENQIELNDANIEAKKNLAWIFKRQKKIARAFTLLQEVLKVESSDKQVIDNLNKGGWLELEGKQLEDLIVFYEDQIELNDANIEAKKNLAWIFKRQKKIARAFSLLQEVLQVAPSDQQVIKNLNVGGWLELEGKQLEDLIVFYQKQIEMDPNNIAPKKNYAWILKKSGDLHQSFQILCSVLNQYPNDEQTIISLCEGDWHTLPGVELNRLLDLHQVWLKSDEALKLFALKSLGFLYFHMDNFEKADHYLSQVYESNKDDIETLSTLADIHDKNNSIKKAIHYYQHLLAFKQDDLSLLKILGWLFKKNKQYKKALEVFKQILVLQPHDPDALDEVSRLNKTPIQRIVVGLKSKLGIE